MPTGQVGKLRLDGSLTPQDDRKYPLLYPAPVVPSMVHAGSLRLLHAWIYGSCPSLQQSGTQRHFLGGWTPGPGLRGPTEAKQPSSPP